MSLTTVFHKSFNAKSSCTLSANLILHRREALPLSLVTEESIVSCIVVCLRATAFVIDQLTLYVWKTNNILFAGRFNARCMSPVSQTLC